MEIEAKCANPEIHLDISFSTNYRGILDVKTLDPFCRMYMPVEGVGVSALQQTQTKDSEPGATACLSALLRNGCGASHTLRSTHLEKITDGKGRSVCLDPNPAKPKAVRPFLCVLLYACYHYRHPSYIHTYPQASRSIQAGSMALNRIEGHNLYIGGVISLRNKAALQEANITHVVSVLRFQQLKIEVDDVDDEDLLQYFASANAFIQAGLDAGGGVLIHCAMGKSRSATICIAYLLHQHPKKLDPESALELIRKTRSIAEPNDDFMRQLWLYHEMGCPDDVTKDPRYLRWTSHRQIELSAACGKAPEIDVVRFEDELQRDSLASAGDKVTEIRCRKCRRMLATTPFINPHDQDTKKPTKPSPGGLDCAHIFLHPLTWMRPCLFPGPAAGASDPSSASSTSFEDGGGLGTASDEPPLSGRLTCPNPKCEANVGKFAWQGLRCSCGKWVVPAIGVARARVDVTERTVDSTTSVGSSNINDKNGINNRLGAMGIRLPPHMRGKAHENNDQNPRNNL
uniref:protein-tyrosine-phosphatase n=2 Tax=Talaromyces marneffei PM1 TaxID=1077442 RepID=A0A093VM79_TALMA